MFGLFGKKKSTIEKITDSLDRRSVEVLGNAASLVLMQLLPFQGKQNYMLELQSQFCRGYIYGFVYAVIKASGLPSAVEDYAMMRIIAGHGFILHDQGIDAIKYVRESIGFLDNVAFDSAYRQGVDEALGCFEPEQKKPFGLAEYLANH